MHLLGKRAEGLDRELGQQRLISPLAAALVGAYSKGVRTSAGGGEPRLHMGPGRAIMPAPRDENQRRLRVHARSIDSGRAPVVAATHELGGNPCRGGRRANRQVVTVTGEGKRLGLRG